MKKKYYLGVDIGGTKSHALLADDHGIVIGFGAAGPGNHEVVGYEGLRGVLHEITQHALDTSGILKEDIQGAGFGIGGYDWPSEREPTMEAINTLQLNTQYEIVNDTIIGLIAGAPRGWGVALVAGTGSNCWGWDQDHNIGRVTGNGPEFGECCGASDLVPKAVQAISAQWSMRGPETDLSKAFIDLVKARDITDILKFIDYEAINGAEDKDKAISEQFKLLQEGKSYLFEGKNEGVNDRGLNAQQKENIANLTEQEKYNELYEAARKNPNNSKLQMELFLQKAKLKK